MATSRLPQYLERPQLVTRSGESQLQFQEFHQWGGNLAKDLTRVLTENLSQLLRSDSVVSAPHTLRVRPDFRVEVEVLRFERAGDARVHLTAKANLVTGPPGEGAAVLLRAVEPVTGTLHMRRRRGVESDRLLASGPGRLSVAFGITQAVNGEPMASSAVVVQAGEGALDAQVLETPRIGISRAAELPLRFVIRGSPWLSRRSPLAEAAG